MTTPLNSGDQFNLGNAVGFVDINTSRATSALQSFRQQFQNFFRDTASGFRQMGQTVSSFGQTLTMGLLPVAGGFKIGIDAASSFQDALAEIEARTGATAEQMAMVRAEALRLGAETSFSGQQAADGMLMLLTAGLDVNETIAAMGPILDGAAASGEDLGRTADYVTGILASFNLEASEARRVVDVMAKGAGASPATMGQMGEAMADVAGVAAMYGISLENLGAILTIYAQRNIRGAEAGTQLRSMMKSLTEQTDVTKKAWDDLGVSLFDANGQMRDLDTVFQEVEAALATKSDQERIRLVNQLAGAYGQLGFTALLSSDGIAATRAEMDRQASASEVAQKRMKTFSGRVESLRGSIETLLITAFTPFIEMLTPILEQIIEVVNSITQWIEANQAIVQPILKVLGALILLGPTLFVVGKAFALVGFLIGAIASPINLVLLAITGLAAAWTANVGGIQETTARVVGFIREAFGILIDRDFKSFGSGLHEDNPIFDFFYTLHDTVIPILRNLHFYIQAAFVIISDFITFKVMPALQVLWNVLETSVLPALGRLWEWMQNNIPGAIDTAVKAIGEFIRNNTEVIVVVGAGAVVFGLAKAAAIGLSWAFGVLQNTAKLLSGAFAVLTSPAVLLSGAIIGILLAANSLYPGGLVQLFKDATLAAQQLSFLGLGLLSAAATGASIVVNGFRQTMELLLPKIKEWFVDNSGIILGLGALVIALLSASAHIKIFQAVIVAVRAVSALASAVWGLMSGALTAIGVTSAGATASIGAFAASMTAALGPILAVAAAIAGVIRQIQIFNEQTGAVAIATQTEVASQAAAGQLTEQQLKDMIWNASLQQFNGNALMAAILQPFLFNELAGDTQFAPAMARGTNFVPQNTLAWLDQGEAVVPREFNPAAGGVNNSGPQFHGPVYFEIKANSEAEGRAAARGFADEFEELLRVT